MKKLLILGTGGTIACVPSTEGMVPRLELKEMLAAVPELGGLAQLDSLQLFSLDSSNITPKHWQELALALAEYYDTYDGFIILHGTDTMAYTAAALSQMLHACGKPVVLTGAQLSLQEPGSDAPENLMLSVKAATSDAEGVFLAFGGQVIHGLKAKKLYTEAFHGFASINSSPAARLEQDELVWLDKRGGAVGPGRFSVQTELEARVAVVKLTPGLSCDILEYYLKEGYRGLVLEGFGAGGVPTGEPNWLPGVARLLQAGMRIICATQCLYDGVHLDRYPMGILAEKLGAEAGGMLTVEALLTKLMVELAGK